MLMCRWLWVECYKGMKNGGIKSCYVCMYVFYSYQHKGNTQWMIFQILKRWQYNINAMCQIQVYPRESIKIQLLLAYT